MRLIVGLGNPGLRFAGTRHNAGFLVVDELTERRGGTWRSRSYAEVTQLGSLTLMKPTTMMNASGRAVQAEATRRRIRPEEILVIHDDLDLPLGRLRFKGGGGGAGGARGIGSIVERLGPNFPRLKLGIGRPPQGRQAQDWVLSRFREDELELLGRIVQAAADAVEFLLEHGLTAAMNRTNGLDLRSSAGNHEAAGGGASNPDTPSSS